MNLDQRLENIETQKRAFIEGTVESIGDQWIFFDEINERAYQLYEIGDKFEVKKNQTWEAGTLIENGLLKLKNSYLYLSNGDELRYQKQLYPSYEELLEELPDTSFYGFIHTLNQLSYSLFDCIYCHNFLSFLPNNSTKKGMNTIIFDNEEMVCAVQHHFIRGRETKDRFEITLSDGSRTICGQF